MFTESTHAVLRHPEEPLPFTTEQKSLRVQAAVTVEETSKEFPTCAQEPTLPFPRDKRPSLAHMEVFVALLAFVTG